MEFPPAQASPVGFVFCHPFAEERKCAYRMLVELGRTLAEAGGQVLRFDYSGTGESDGDGSIWSVHEWVEDVIEVVSCFSVERNLDRICLIGLRMGANLAVRAANRGSDVTSLVLWDPILDLPVYLSQELGIGPSGMDLAGYWVPPEFVRTCGEVDSLALTRSIPALALDLSRPAGSAEQLGGKSAGVEGRFIPDVPPFWRSLDLPRAPALLRATLEWVAAIEKR